MFVGIKAEGGGIAPTADALAGYVGPQGVAGVVDQKEVVGAGDLRESGPICGQPEDIDGQQRAGGGREGGFGAFGVEGIGGRVDVYEAGAGILIKQHVRRGDETERRRQHFVAVAEVEPGHDEVQCRRATAYRDGVAGSATLRHARLKNVLPRPHRQAVRVEHVMDILSFEGTGVGLR